MRRSRPAPAAFLSASDACAGGRAGDCRGLGLHRRLAQMEANAKHQRQRQAEQRAPLQQSLSLFTAPPPVESRLASPLAGSARSTPRSSPRSAVGLRPRSDRSQPCAAFTFSAVAARASASALLALRVPLLQPLLARGKNLSPWPGAAGLRSPRSWLRRRRSRRAPVPPRQLSARGVRPEHGPEAAGPAIRRQSPAGGTNSMVGTEPSTSPPS